MGDFASISNGKCNINFRVKVVDKCCCLVTMSRKKSCVSMMVGPGLLFSAPGIEVSFHFDLPFVRELDNSYVLVVAAIALRSAFIMNRKL